MLPKNLKTASVRLAVAACVWASVPAQATGMTRPEVLRDPRFAPLTPPQDVRIKVVNTVQAFPYFGIPGNGCARGSVFVRGELASVFDGAPAGQRVVLRLDDASFPLEKVGNTLVFSGLRRAGIGPDGTLVYCGKLPVPVAFSTPAEPRRPTPQRPHR